MSALSVARSELESLGMDRHVPDHLEDIVMGSHPSLGEDGPMTLRDILHQYAHVLPAPGEPVTGWITSVQHEIAKADAPAGLQTEQTCVKEMLDGGQIESSDSPWVSPWCWL